MENRRWHPVTAQRLGKWETWTRVQCILTSLWSWGTVHCCKRFALKAFSYCIAEHTPTHPQPHTHDTSAHACAYTETYHQLINDEAIQHSSDMWADSHNLRHFCQIITIKQNSPRKPYYYAMADEDRLDNNKQMMVTRCLCWWNRGWRCSAGQQNQPQHPGNAPLKGRNVSKHPEPK